MDKEIQTIAQNLRSGQTQQGTHSTQQTSRFTEDEKKLINAFYSAVRTIYGADKFNWAFGVDEDLVSSKRYYGLRLCEFTLDELVAKVQSAKDLGVAGDSKYDKPDIDRILSVASVDWEHARQGKTWAEIQAEPILNLGETPALENQEVMRARDTGTPESNPNYFKDLLEGSDV